MSERDPRLIIRMSDEQRAEIEARAKKLDMNMSDYVRRAVARAMWLEDQPKGTKYYAHRPGEKVIQVEFI